MNHNPASAYESSLSSRRAFKLQEVRYDRNAEARRLDKLKRTLEAKRNTDSKEAQKVRVA